MDKKFKEHLKEFKENLKKRLPQPLRKKPRIYPIIKHLKRGLLHPFGKKPGELIVIFMTAILFLFVIDKDRYKNMDFLLDFGISVAAVLSFLFSGVLDDLVFDPLFGPSPQSFDLSKNTIGMLFNSAANLHFFPSSCGSLFFSLWQTRKEQNTSGKGS